MMPNEIPRPHGEFEALVDPEVVKAANHPSIRRVPFALAASLVPG